MSNKTMHWLSKKIKDVNERKASSIDPSKYPEETFELFSVPIFPTGVAEIIQGKDIGSTKQIVKCGDVLLCKINPRINRVWVVSESKGYRQIASSEWIVVRSSMHDDRFLKYFFQAGAFRELLCSDVSGVGGSLTRAKPKLVNEYEVLVAPLAEQKRIVEKLDEVLAQVDTIKARLDGIPALLKRFRQSVLASAVSGKLTEEWREGQSLNATTELRELYEARKQICNRLGKKDKELKRVTNSEIKEEIPESWVYSTLDPFLDIERAGMKTGPFGSLLKKHEHLHAGVPVLGIENISSGNFSEGSKIYVSAEKSEELSMYDIVGGDLIISRSGTVGDICVVPDNLGTMRFSTNLMRVSFLKNSIDSRYFCFLFLGSTYVLRQVSSLCKGSTRDFLNQKILGSVYYPIPPLTEQKEIVRLVDQYFAFADTIEAQVKKAQARVDNLTQSILAKAFRGELVEQDPNDEPADKLLERIALARKEAEALAKAAKKAQSTKSTAKKKVAKSA
ncbi:restriction endonuclease subunit S [Vibrio harveyi]|uniref:restriction endonuclease subunit S n=1 Tax=Vibrio harveyi TaxID=669 RepID=UPI003CED7043